MENQDLNTIEANFVGEELAMPVKTKKNWTDEERTRAMILYTSSGKTLNDVSKETNIPVSTLKFWSGKYKWGVFKNDSGEQFEELLKLTTDRLGEYNDLLVMIKSLWAEAQDIKEKSIVLDMLLKVDKRTAEWIVMAAGQA